MAAYADHVVKSFIAGKRDRSGNFTTDGKGIYTYDVRMAHRTDDGAIVYDTAYHSDSYQYGAAGTFVNVLTPYSRTSNMHQRATLRVLGDRRIGGTDIVLPSARGLLRALSCRLANIEGK